MLRNLGRKWQNNIGEGTKRANLRGNPDKAWTKKIIQFTKFLQFKNT